MNEGRVGEHVLLRQAAPRVRTPLSHSTEHLLNIGRGRALVRQTAQLAVVVLLLCLAAENIYVRATGTGQKDGALWSTTPEGFVAPEIAPDSPAARAGLRPGDILAEIDRRPVDTASDVVERLHHASSGDATTYTLIRTATRETLRVTLSPIPSGARGLYYILAPVGIFSLLVGAGVRFRRPDNQATLHFFWLTVAFFGMLAFSFSGRLDTLDWTIYWADVTSTLLLPPLIVHFALVFPERPDSWAHSDSGRTALPLLYLPALLLFAATVATLMRAPQQGVVFSNVLTLVERGEVICLAAGLIVGLGIMIRALGRARSVTARRQLRWIVGGTAFGAVPFVFGYAIPFALGFTPLRGAAVTAVLLGVVPLAFASAIVRYRLMDVEVIIKRALVYAAALAAIAAMYAILLRLARAAFLGSSDRPNSIIALLATLVVVLLSRPVKNAIQTGLDRVYYRDRYDYRRALVGFARDLNSDLDLQRLSERLVHRIRETLVVDRMALMLAPVSAGRDGDFAAIAHIGFASPPPFLPRSSEVGARLTAGHTLTLDDPLAQVRLDAAEVDFWREAGIHYFVPCVSKEGTIAVMALGRKASAEPLSSEDMALLAAVAAQAATALENGRLYRELRVKADELQRLREFSENILESLNDGLAVVNRDDRIIRWNRRLEELYGIRHEDAVTRRFHRTMRSSRLEVLRSARRESPEGAAFYRVPLTTRHESVRR